MAPRPNWKGYLKLSLVSCPVALYPATSTSQRVRFNIINRKTGNRIRNQVVDAETGEPVEQDDRVKGYQVEKGEYVLVEDDELDKVALESTHTIDIEPFVPRDEVDEIYLDESYYIVPQDKVGARGLRGDPRGDEEGGSGRPRARGAVPARAPADAGSRAARASMATALRYKTEVRDEKDYFDDIPERQGAGRHARARRAYPRTARRRTSTRDKFEDRYEDALMRADQGQAAPARSRRSVAEAQAEQRHQPDGRAAPQREGRAAAKAGGSAGRARRRRKRAAPQTRRTRTKRPASAS